MQKTFPEIRVQLRRWYDLELKRRANFYFEGVVSHLTFEVCRRLLPFRVILPSLISMPKMLYER